MNTQAQLRHQAIEAAKVRNWEAAASYNQQLLELNASDIGALNRLGVAYLQLDKKKEAKDCFLQSLSIDGSNSIAKKHLQNLRSNHVVAAPSFTRQYFIEEPGKTKTVELVRLAGKSVLENVSVGQSCALVLKNRFISVEIAGHYIGALPEDLSFRLSKLIQRGNTYSCAVRSCNGGNHCSVFLKETLKSPKNADFLSFPISKSTSASGADIDESVLLDDDIPVEIVNVDGDFEGGFEDVGSDDDEV